MIPLCAFCFYRIRRKNTKIPAKAVILGINVRVTRSSGCRVPEEAVSSTFLCSASKGIFYKMNDKKKLQKKQMAIIVGILLALSIFGFFGIHNPGKARTEAFQILKDDRDYWENQSKMQQEKLNRYDHEIKQVGEFCEFNSTCFIMSENFINKTKFGKGLMYECTTMDYVPNSPAFCRFFYQEKGVKNGTAR